LRASVWPPWGVAVLSFGRVAGNKKAQAVAAVRQSLGNKKATLPRQSGRGFWY